jgi:hypothetical protein
MSLQSQMEHLKFQNMDFDNQLFMRDQEIIFIANEIGFIKQKKRQNKREIERLEREQRRETAIEATKNETAKKDFHAQYEL